MISDSFDNFNSIEIIYNKDGIDKYCQKPTKYLDDNHSGKMIKHTWKINYLEKNPQLQTVVDNPYPW